MKKIKKKELEMAQDLSTKYRNALLAVGEAELGKHLLAHKAEGFRNEIENFKATLQEAYGDIEINLETGEYSESERLVLALTIRTMQCIIR